MSQNPNNSSKSLKHISFWKSVWKQYTQNTLGMFALVIVAIFCLVGIYAPFLASSKPLVVNYEGSWYFPLFRYLVYNGFYTKWLDIFFNILIFTFPFFVLAFFLPKKFKSIAIWTLACIQAIAFIYYLFGNNPDPAANAKLSLEKYELLQKRLQENNDLEKHIMPIPTEGWAFELKYMTPYAKINALVNYRTQKLQQNNLMSYPQIAALHPSQIPTLWQMARNNEEKQITQLELFLKNNRSNFEMQKQTILELNKAPHPLSAQDKEKLLEARQGFLAYANAEVDLKSLQQKRLWFETESQKLNYLIMPLLRPFHWEEDAGGSQSFNQLLPWWDLTRINRKDLLAGLLFGVRVSMVVGIVSISLALLIGIPIGALAGFYGGTFDIFVSRLLEIWEAMPTFFMLLLVVAMTQSKSILIVISVIGLFGWTGFSRFMRGEFFKQRNLPYVEAGKAQGFSNLYIMFSHILPNAIPPILTLMPFAIMGAIASEAGLSFLGLGEEGSCSWGVLMDEGRMAFPGESYLLWPPAILLTILLIAIAIVGDALRDALDPKLHIKET